MSVITHPHGGMVCRRRPNQGSIQLPNQTLYCNNLNDRIKRKDLIPLLYELFLPYGNILEIVVRAPVGGKNDKSGEINAQTDKPSAMNAPSSRGPRLRGQAFIIFSDIAGATSAMRCVQGRNVLGKVIHIAFAREKSHITSSKQPNYQKLKNAFIGKTTQGSTEKEGTTDKGPKEPSKETTTISIDKQKSENSRDDESMEEEEDDTDQTCTKKNTTDPSVEDANDIGTPSNGIYVSRLPEIMTQEALKALFSQFEGYADCRLIRERGVGFVDFNTPSQSEIALQALQGFQVTPDHAISLKFTSAIDRID